MARAIITTQTIFFLLLLFVLAIFFYNVVHFSVGLKDKAYQDRIAEYKGEISRLKTQVNEMSICNPENSGDKETKPIIKPPPASPAVILSPVNNKLVIPVIPILVMSCNRDDYLQTTLTKLFQYKPAGFPVVVSQGCGHEGVEQLLRDKYANNVIALKHYKKPNIEPYFAIAQHYGWALSQIFSNMNYDAAIILEDDMEISPDFFDYFISLYPILNGDPSLYCISSWNDNGMDDSVSDNKAIRRTEIFPGLGWMMEKSLWKEIETIWPEKYWDEFMRLPAVRKNRACLYPEISRNKNIGIKGTSQSQFWDKISRIKFNEEYVNFTSMDLSYLYKEQYDETLMNNLKNAKVVSSLDVQNYQNEDLRINYHDFAEFQNIARFFKIMDDEKEGMPRTSYKGVVTFNSHNNRIFVTPETFLLS